MSMSLRVGWIGSDTSNAGTLSSDESLIEKTAFGHGEAAFEDSKKLGARVVTGHGMSSIFVVISRQQFRGGRTA